jgi:hypothetical protein
LAPRAISQSAANPARIATVAIPPKLKLVIVPMAAIDRPRRSTRYAGSQVMQK